MIERLEKLVVDDALHHVPFGGRKVSTYGPRERGAYARESYTTVKTACIAP